MIRRATIRLADGLGALFYVKVDHGSPLLDTSSLRLLLAEDDTDAVILFNRLLLKCRAKARHASNGAVVIEYLTPYTEPGGGRFAPHAIFLDIKMPLQSGFDVLKWMRAEKSFDGTAAVIMSFSSEPSDIEMARSLGANAYFEKFPSEEQLLKLLSSICAQQGPIGRALLPEPGLLRLEPTPTK